MWCSCCTVMLLLFCYLYSTRSGVQASALPIKEFSNADLLTLKNEGLPHNENIMQNCVMLKTGRTFCRNNFRNCDLRKKCKMSWIYRRVEQNKELQLAGSRFTEINRDSDNFEVAKNMRDKDLRMRRKTTVIVISVSCNSRYEHFLRGIRSDKS